MQRITERQRQYLFYLHSLKVDDRTLKSVADYFTVNRNSAVEVISALADKGLIAKDGSTFKLTTKGRMQIDSVAEKFDDLRICYEETDGLSKEQARERAVHIVCNHASHAVDAEADKKLAFLYVSRTGNSVHNELSNVPDGVYFAPFSVFKPGARHLSMGNKGFCHPSRFVFRNGCAALELRAIHIRHKALTEEQRRFGILQRLRYDFGGNWADAVQIQNRWLVAGSAVALRESISGLEGFLRIHAYAAKNCGMPDSKADSELHLHRSDVSKHVFLPSG
jgi:Mn-dependent DtxR family transcriptional regulator